MEGLQGGAAHAYWVFGYAAVGGQCWTRAAGFGVLPPDSSVARVSLSLLHLHSFGNENGRNMLLYHRNAQHAIVSQKCTA